MPKKETANTTLADRAMPPSTTKSAEAGSQLATASRKAAMALRGGGRHTGEAGLHRGWGRRRKQHGTLWSRGRPSALRLRRQQSGRGSGLAGR